MGIFDWVKKPQSQPDNSCAPIPRSADVNQPTEDKSNTTSVERPDFSMVLPFRWISVPSEEGYEFRNQVFPEQLIVTILKSKRPLERSELQKAVEEILTIRIGAIGRLSQGHAHTSTPIYVQSDTSVEGRVFGVDIPNKVRFAFVTRGSAEKIVTAAITRYTLEDVPPLEVHATMIFDFLKLR